MKKTVLVATLMAMSLFLVVTTGEAAKKPKYEGYKKCGGCHKSQKESWLETRHAKAMESLKKGVKVKEKKKADLKDKDYTEDKKCLGCHATGFGKKGGYKIGLEKKKPKKAKFLMAVGCEDCHGPGSVYRKAHKKASARLKEKKERTPRKSLIELGEYVSTEDIHEACKRCHMNYEGSPWKGAKKPYTPFTPKIDPKYKFDFDKAVQDKEVMHEHFKLRGVYEGTPVFKYRDDFQKAAKEPAAGEEEKE